MVIKALLLLFCLEYPLSSLVPSTSSYTSFKYQVKCYFYKWAHHIENPSFCLKCQLFPLTHHYVFSLFSPLSSTNILCNMFILFNNY